MSDDSVTTRVLIEIRDELRVLSTRLDRVNLRIDQTNVRLDHTNLRIDLSRDEIKAEIVESETRQATRVTQQSAILLDLKAVFDDRTRSPS